MTPKVRILVEQIARMRISGIRDGVIAASFGLSQSGLSRIVALDEYRDIEESLLHGHLSKMDEALAGNISGLKKFAEQAVPVALRTLLEAAQQRRDLRAAISASAEILDRDPDGSFSKNKHVSLSEGAPAVSEEMLNSVASEADAAAEKLKKIPAASEVIQ